MNAYNAISAPLHVLVYGEPGTMKTVGAHMWPRTRTLDFDNGMKSVFWAIREGLVKKKPEEIVYKTLIELQRKSGLVTQSEAYDFACDAIDEWMKTPDDFDTIIVDSGSSLTEFAINKAMEENARMELSQSKSKSRSAGFRIMAIQDWGSAMNMFQQFMDWVRSLNKNVVLICHEYQETNDDGAVMRIQPLLIGQLRQKIAKDFDEVWYSFKEGTRNNVEFKLQTIGDSRRMAKSRLGCLSPVEEWDFYAIRKKVADYYDIDEAALWTSVR